MAGKRIWQLTIDLTAGAVRRNRRFFSMKLPATGQRHGIWLSGFIGSI